MEIGAGRHTRGKDFEADCEKLNNALLLGWHLLRFTPNMGQDGTAVAPIRTTLEDEGSLTTPLRGNI
jgi:hypothetical protein